LLAGVAAAFFVTWLAEEDALVVIMLVVVLLDSEVMVEEPDFAVMVATMTTVRVMVEVTSEASAAIGRHATRRVDRRMLECVAAMEGM